MIYILFGLLVLVAASPLQSIHARDGVRLGKIERAWQFTGSQSNPQDVARAQRLKRLVELAWADAKLLADAITHPDPKKDYDTPKAQWFGTDVFDDGYRQRLDDNLNRIRDIFNDNWDTDEFIRFHEGGVRCKSIQTKAYTVSQQPGGTGPWIHDVHLCDNFFQLPPLGKAFHMYNKKSSKSDQLNAEHFESSLGKTMFHEVMHFGSVTKPQAVDKVYGVSKCWKTAANSGSGITLENADSYAFYAVAVYARDFFGSNDLMSPPQQDRDELLVIPDDSDDAPTDDAAESDGDAADDNADSAIYVPLNPVICREIDSTTAWVTYDSLNPLLPTYCQDAANQGDDDPDSGAITRTYNSGGNMVTFRTEFSPGTYKANYDSCMAAMTAIKDDCNGNDPENPLNSKHGGSYIDENVLYSITPETPRYSTGQCSVVVTEMEDFSNPATSYQLSVEAYDGNGDWVCSSGGFQVAGANSPMTMGCFYDLLLITPEHQDNDYVQFSISSTAWTSKDTQATNSNAYCQQTQDWEGIVIEKRVMQCYFPC